ncbi:MAG TPA: helix-turn-helix domain-containing protein [Candidatus Dormibacteraeota bacterium]|jgi:AcrR family transcriptional regulator
MPTPVKRPYDNSRRAAHSRLTRREVIDAATALFIEAGYPATTVDAISRAARTPPTTVYRLFGSKRGILAAVVDAALGGDDEPIAFVDRPRVRAALSEPDPRLFLDSFARHARELLERSADLQHTLATASSVDQEAAEMLTEIRRQRHAGQSRIAAGLAARRALSPEVEERHAADIVYLLMSPEVYRILTAERGWEADTYELWLARSLRLLLLDRQEAEAALPDQGAAQQEPSGQARGESLTDMCASAHAQDIAPGRCRQHLRR